MKPANNHKRLLRMRAMLVLDAYHELRSTVGHPGVINIRAALCGGSGTKYKIKYGPLEIIDYIVDIERATHEGLSPAEWQIARFWLLKDTPAFENLTYDMITVLERLGRIYTMSGLYPTATYFSEKQTYASN